MIEGHQHLAGAANGDNDCVLPRERTAGITSAHLCPAILLVEIVGPHDVTGLFIQGLHFPDEADGKQQIAHKRRRRVGAVAVLERQTGGGRSIALFPDRFSVGCIERNHKLLIASAVHRKEAAPISNYG